MRTAIIVIVYNNADLLLRQKELLDKYTREDYDLIVIDNSIDGTKTKGIKYHAKRCRAMYKKTFANDMSPSNSHAFASNFAYVQYHEQYDLMMFLDHDIFPVKPYSIGEILDGRMIAGLHQMRKGQEIYEYFWGGLVMINNMLIDHERVDFTPCIIDGTALDTGGSFHYLIKEMAEPNYLWFDEKYRQNPGFNKNKYNFFSMLHDETFMHFIGSSNWMGMRDHEERINSLLNILQTYTDEKTQ